MQARFPDTWVGTVRSPAEPLDVTAIHHVYTVVQIVDLLSGNGVTEVELFSGPGGEPYEIGSARLLLTARRMS